LTSEFPVLLQPLNFTFVLSKIQSPYDLRAITSPEELCALSQEIRQFLIDTLSEIDHAHFSGNLGVVELSMALHYVFETPDDLLFWDIGHQAYVHKILTGRRAELPQIRTKDGISGFLSRKESIYDVLGAGHAATSISTALGAALANKLQKKTTHHVAIIGDASLSSGMAFEALNHLSDHPEINLCVIINDNNCSIDPSVGGLSRHLQELAKKQSKTLIFSALQLECVGPIDGHNLEELTQVLQDYKTKGGVRIIHCITQKGKGFLPAEQGNATHWHAPGKFNVVDGSSQSINKPKRYQDVFAETLIELAQDNEKIVAISAGMLSGTSLSKFQAVFPERCFDVGIAEQHAVTFSAGLATQGILPFCAIYSTFLQRALDQVIHDVALQNLPVVFCVVRAGLVGHDGATHQGVFDIALLRSIPNLVIASPSSAIDLRNLLYTTTLGIENPIALRYPRGKVYLQDYQKPFESLEIGKGRTIQTGKDAAVLCLGTCYHELKIAAEKLAEKGISLGIYDMIFVKPLDEALLHEVCSSYQNIITIEEAALMGGFGSAVAEFMVDHSYKNRVLRLGLPDEFVEHASQAEQRAQYGLDASGMEKVIQEFLLAQQ
jgi:1-deoxy-D-xylulose-5-phosphate synthase